MPDAAGMAFTDQMTLAVDQTFKDRVTMAALIAAQQIASEAVAANQLQYHTQRQNLAFAVINDPTGMASRFAYSVAANPAITSESSDSDIQFTVNSNWDALAGIPSSLKPS